MVIDGHAHVYAEKNADRIVSAFTELHHMEPTSSVGAGTVPDLIARMSETDTDYTVLANFAPVKSVEKVNEWTLSVAAEFPSLIPLISVYPGMSLEAIKEYIALGARGIKMHNGIQDYDPSDPELMDIYAFCEANRLPVTFHCGETSRVHLNEYCDTAHILSAVRRFPGIPFILTHLAAGDPETVFRIAEECPNAVFDTSITMTGEECIYRIHDPFWKSDSNVVSAFRQIGCDRIAYGSDYPYGNPASDIRRIRQLDLTTEEKNLILGENTYRLYFPDGENNG